MSYTAEYRCVRCQTRFSVVQGDYGCPEGRVAPPDTPCGRSGRTYRCAACPRSPACPKCRNLWVEWLNYEELAANGFGRTPK